MISYIKLRVLKRDQYNETERDPKKCKKNKKNCQHHSKLILKASCGVLVRKVRQIISLSLYIYIYIYVCVCVCVYLCVMEYVCLF